MRDKEDTRSGFQIQNYLYRTRWTVVIVGLIVFMTHGSVLFTQRFGIDTDFIMYGDHNFNEIGRQGLVWLAKILGLEWFNLYYAQVLTLFFMMSAPISFGYLFWRVYGRSTRVRLSLLVLGVSFIVSPFWAAQIYFLNQSAQILFACVLIAESLLLVETARADFAHKWFCALLAAALMNIIFACYQVLVVVYAAGAAAVFILNFLREEECSVRKQLRWIGFHAVCFLVGFFSYLIITKLYYFEGSAYLSGQVAWKRVGLSEGIHQCITAVWQTFQSNLPYSRGGYGIYALLFLGVTVYWLLTAGRMKRGSSALILLAAVFLILSPVFFIIIYGGELQDRMQLVMPLSQGSMLYLTVLLFPEAKKQKRAYMRIATCVVAVGLTLVLYRDTTYYLSCCNRFYYTDEWVFQYDKQIARKVYMDVRETMADNGLGDSFDKYLFLGYPSIPYNDTALIGNAMGRSHFQYDTQYLVRPRIVYLMRNLGYPLSPYYSDGAQAAFFAYFEDYFGERVDEMPSYPEPGYVQYLSDDIGLEYLVIKLGDDWRLLEGL